MVNVGKLIDMTKGSELEGLATMSMPWKEACIKLFTAAGDPARLEIGILLSSRGRMNVGDIASHFKLSRPAISHHLKVLKDAKVVRSEKVGQEVFCWLDTGYVATMLRSVADMLEECQETGP